MDSALFLNLGLALGLGILVGMQREWAKPSWIAGIRTIPLLTLFGWTCAYLSPNGETTLIAAGLITTLILLALGFWAEARSGKEVSGLTSEAACLILFMVGALVGRDRQTEAVVLTGITAVLLHWKGPMHRFVKRIGNKDLNAITKLVLIGLVILPILPDQTFGPYGVLNPFEIWLIVVLIVGISLGAYAVSRLIGSESGLLVGGLLGGLISSTATTVSYARETQSNPATIHGAALVILVASTVVFTRVLIEIGLVAPKSLLIMIGPLFSMLVFMSMLSGLFYFLTRRKISETRIDKEPPSELKAAIFFGLLYALILLAVALASNRFGTAGLYVASLLSGLTDMDAITLSIAKMVTAGHVTAEMGWRAILLGALSNMVFKAVIVAVVGPMELLKWILALFGAAMVAGGAIFWLWPI